MKLDLDIEHAHSAPCSPCVSIDDKDQIDEIRRVFSTAMYVHKQLCYVGKNM